VRLRDCFTDTLPLTFSGLLQGSLGLTGFDAVAHMIEEIPNPTIEGPKSE
jgi:hypothetical protein